MHLKQFQNKTLYLKLKKLKNISLDSNSNDIWRYFNFLIKLNFLSIIANKQGLLCNYCERI